MNYGPYMPMQFGYQNQTKEINPVQDKITQPITNISRNFVEIRVLNDKENVETLYVQNKTLFINDKYMVMKGIDGSLEKWEINKIYPVDPKDQKIKELERQIQELKEMIKYEPSSSIDEVVNDTTSEQ